MHFLHLTITAAVLLTSKIKAHPNGGSDMPSYKGGSPPGTSPPPYVPVPPDGNPFSLTNDYEQVVSGVETWTLFLQDVCSCTANATICPQGDLCVNGSQGNLCGGQWVLSTGGLAVGTPITYITGDGSCSVGCNLAGGQPDDGLSCDPFSD